MEKHGVDDFRRDTVALEIIAADPGMIPADVLSFDLANLSGARGVGFNHALKLIGEGGCEHDFAYVMEQTDDVVGVVVDE